LIVISRLFKSYNASIFARAEPSVANIDHRIKQGIEHVTGAMPQQFRLTFAARPNILKSPLSVIAYGQYIVRTHKHVDLSYVELAFQQLHDVQHGKQRIAIFIDLGPLMTVARIFNRQRMQVELGLHVFKCLVVGIAQRHPHKTTGLIHIPMNLVGGNIGHLSTIPVENAIDQHSLFRWGSAVSSLKILQAL
jgi:hypothetical protein